MNKSNTMIHAERELDILSKSYTDPYNRPVIEEFAPEILALVNAFGNSGQSGGSAPFVAQALSQAIKHLCLQEPICPITGIDEEWMDVYECCGGNPTFQNNRCSAIFKDGRNDMKPYYLDAIVFRGQNGSCFTGNSVKLRDGSNLRSTQTIKSFPFTPKTFYVDVIETEWSDKTETVKQAGGGWWTSVVKDEEQLKEVFEYYERYW